jgi:hypothetical protein
MSSNAVEQMRINDNINGFKEIINKPISDSKSHTPHLLVSAIFSNYYNVKNIKKLIFDFDDTLVSRDTNLLNISNHNCELVNQLNDVAICTGNSIKKLIGFFNNITVYANRGIDVYLLNVFQYVLLKCLDNSFKMNKKEIDSIYKTLVELNVNKELIDVRENSVVAIKPIVKEDRELIVTLLKDRFENFEVKSVGRSTIEICKPGLGKDIILNDLNNFTFVGDEIDGNDKPLINQDKVNFISVKGVKETNMLLTVILHERTFSNNSSR